MRPDETPGTTGTAGAQAIRDRRIAGDRDRARLYRRARRAAGQREPDRRVRYRSRARPLCRGGRGFGQAAAQAQVARHRASRIGRRRDRVCARCPSRDAGQFAPRPRRSPAHRPPAHQCRARDRARDRGDRQDLRGDARSRISRRASTTSGWSARGSSAICSKKPYIAYSGLSGGAIILAEEVTPADTALMDPRRIGGFATEFGGPEGHTAIMARALGLPAVLAVPGLLERARADAQAGDRWFRRDRHHRPVARDGRGLPGTPRRVRPRAAPIRPAAARAGGHPRRRRDPPRSQSRTAGRARTGAGQRRDGARPGAHRVPLHEPRGPAGRGRAVRVLRRPGDAGWRGAR